MTQFKKGVSGNPNGRPKGSISEKTKIWNEIGDWFANEGLSKYQENLMGMMDNSATCEDGMKRYEALLEYFKPKLSRAEVQAEIKESIDLSKLTPETLQKLKDELNPDTDTGGDS